MRRKKKTTASADSIQTIEKTRWVLPRVDSGDADSLAAALQIPRACAAILIGRGIASVSDAHRFLHPAFEDLHAPSSLHGMDRAIERLSRAIRDREKIQIHGDYDVDGTTSTVILKTAIELAGGEASWRIPNRLKDGYGMHLHTIEAAAAEGVTLIISVDTGIRAGDVVRRAAELGIDVIITDHHLPEAELPPALAVINPNQRGCAYPEKNLCGAGVVFKLVQALIATLGWTADRERRVLESFLKLVAIGTVADVVPLVGENRVIVKYGLHGLRSVRNPGLRALLDIAGFSNGNAPSATQVAFRIAPRINAAGRMASASEVIELFLTQDAERARELAGKLHLLNTGRQDEEARVIEAVVEECARTPVRDSQSALVFCGQGWHRGVLGIVASRLVERYHRPVFVLGEEDGLAQGSGRSIRPYHLLGALESMPGLFLKYGGHSHAAGLTLAVENLEAFRERLDAHAAERLTLEDRQPTLSIDALVDFSEIGEHLVNQLERLAPFGAGNPAPVFAAHAVEVAGPPSVLKEKHLRVGLRQANRTVFFTAFQFAVRSGELRPGARVDAAFCLELDNRFGGWSAILKDVRNSL